MKRNAGFTLIELMVTVALAAIIVTLGIPSFQETIRNNRLTTQTNEFVSALNLARSEAVKRGVRVTLCKGTVATGCDTGSSGYEQGWIVFVDPDNDATRDDGEELIRAYGAIPGGMTLSGNTPINKYISYMPDGMTERISGAFQAGTLTICKDHKARQIVISRTGRMQTAATTC